MAVDMQPALIHLFNGLWLVVMFIGLPEATRLSAVGVSIGSSATLVSATYAMLGIALAANFLTGRFALKSAPMRQLAYIWGGVHATLFVIVWMTANGHLRFSWLRSLLRGMSSWPG